MAIARQAISRGTGARGLRGVIEGILQRSMFEIPSSHRKISKCLIGKDEDNEEISIKMIPVQENDISEKVMITV